MNTRITREKTIVTALCATTVTDWVTLPAGAFAADCSSASLFTYLGTLAFR